MIARVKGAALAAAIAVSAVIALPSAAAPQVTISVPWRSSVGQICVSDGVSAATTDPVSTNNTGGVCTAKR